MLSLKRVFVSVGAGIFSFVIGFFLLFFTYKLLNSPPWMSSAMTWILIWPNLFLAKAGVPYPGRILSLSLGPIADVSILSALIYTALSLVRRSPANNTPPPPLHFG